MRISAAEMYDALTMRMEWRSNTHCFATDREKYMFRALVRLTMMVCCEHVGIRCTLFRSLTIRPIGRSDTIGSIYKRETERKRKKESERARRNEWNETETIDVAGVALFVCFSILSHAFDAQARQMADKRTHAHNPTVAAHCWTFSAQQADRQCGGGFVVELRRRDFNSSRYSRLACPLATAKKHLFLLMTSFFVRCCCRASYILFRTNSRWNETFHWPMIRLDLNGWLS